jgi:hypothetical protein
VLNKFTILFYLSFDNQQNSPEVELTALERGPVEEVVDQPAAIRLPDLFLCSILPFLVGNGTLAVEGGGEGGGEKKGQQAVVHRRLRIFDQSAEQLREEQAEWNLTHVKEDKNYKLIFLRLFDFLKNPKKIQK